MNPKKIFIITLFSCLTIEMLGQASEDFFRSTGKIYTVLAVVIILFIVLLYFLIRLDRKINTLEKQIADES